MSSNKYQSPIERTNAFMVKVEDLVREIVIQNNIPYYRIESRMEHNGNVDEGNAYVPVIRIITYFEDSVSPISDVLMSEFDVEIAPTDDLKRMRVESFSSKHVEYKVALKSNRLELIEYKRYGNKVFEIQVCSMLQDAWSGIEKELGYDGATIPDEARRDFYRVGALLEMADLEFLKIRSLLNKKIEEQAPVTSQPEPVAAQQEPAIAAQPEVIPAPVQEQAKPITNIFQSQPISYQPEPEQPQQPVVAFVPASQIVPQRAMPAKNPVGISPQRVPIDRMNGMVSASDVNIVPDQLITVNVNNVQKANNVVQEKVAQVENIAAAVQQAAPVFQPQAPAYTPPAYTPPPAPPVAEKQPEVVNRVEPVMQPVTASPVEAPTVREPIKFNIDPVPNYSQNGNGVAEKTPEVVKEQPAPVPFYEEKPKAPQALDENAQMTDASLKEYVLNSKILKEIDSQISARAGAKMNDEIDIEGDVERLRFLKVFSLKQLHEKLTDNKADIIAFAEKWIGKDNGGSFDMGISLFYLEYLLVGKKNDPGFAVEYVLKFISDNDYSARYIIPTYNSIRQADSSISKFSHLTLK